MSSIHLYRRRPIIVEAVQYDGLNAGSIMEWMTVHGTGEASAMLDADGVFRIKTLESGDGYHIVSLHDFVIRGTANEFYPCKPSIFANIYERLERSQYRGLW